MKLNLNEPCEICGKLRRYEDIHIYQQRISISSFMEFMTKEIKYCFDNPKCYRGVVKMMDDFISSLNEEVKKTLQSIIVN